ncbi:hypothetical protein [Petrocella sp. FN5]|nr:hypothetical protein [Petrocella sp. FN5]MDF1617219.1 hypothetical protein [Petrocella sp. FN5]
MQVIRKFDEDGISFEMLMKSMITQKVDEVINDAVFDEKYEGNLGGIDYE